MWHTVLFQKQFTTVQCEHCVALSVGHSSGADIVYYSVGPLFCSRDSHGSLAHCVGPLYFRKDFTLWFVPLCGATVL